MALTSQEIETLLDVLTREDHNEKRRQERRDITLKGVAPAHGMELVHVTQLSPKGARFQTSVSLELQGEFRILVEQGPMAMTLVLKVVRKESDEDNSYTYGAEILDMIR